MTAALDLAQEGFKTYLLEKSADAGWQCAPAEILDQWDDPQKWLNSLIKKVTSHPNIEVYTDAEITDFQGSVGNFKTEFQDNGKSHVIEHGAVIVATGAEEYKPQEYNYGQDQRVMTQLELEDKLANGDFKACSVVMMQCVGSREKSRRLLQSGLLLTGGEKCPEDQGEEPGDGRIHS